jgi:chromosome segregation ATPase
MALTRKSNVDETLALVKDIDKFKDRIKQLSKVKSAATKSIETAQAKVAGLNKAMDAKVEEAAEIERQAKTLLKSAREAGGKALAEANAVLGKAQRAEKRVVKLKDKLEEEKAGLTANKVGLANDEVHFQNKVVQFKQAAVALCKAV